MEIRRTNIGEIFYYHPNHLGSTSFVTDQNQTITQGFLYAPFGEITTEYNVNFGNNVIPKYSFNAKELDEETGFYYYEARYYAPPTFTSRDVLFEKKPWFTPYHYCSNNPVGRVDPSGMMDEGPEDPPGKKKSNVKSKIEVNVIPQDNLKQQPIVLHIENNSSKSKKSLFQRFKEFFSSHMTGGIYGTADNGQGKETRKGDGPQTDLSNFTSNMPEPFSQKTDKNVHSKQTTLQNDNKEDTNIHRTPQGKFIYFYTNSSEHKGAVATSEFFYNSQDSLEKRKKAENNSSYRSIAVLPK